MATYEEIHGLITTESVLKNKITVAVIIAAEVIRNEDGGTANHANRLLWATSAFQEPEAISKKMLMAVLAANKSASISEITGAADTAIQANVDSIIDIFATGA